MTDSVITEMTLTSAISVADIKDVTMANLMKRPD
jgi:hypothetical protein